jgi:uncharacterized protein (TIGR04255 family)
MSDPFQNTNYRRNFLKQVIARIDLLSPLLDLDTSLPSKIGELAVQTFPIPEPRDAISRQVELGPEGSITQQEQRFKEWRFHGKERTKTLTISKQAVFVEHTAYQTYELVKEEFVRILNRIGELFPDVQTSRVGLRYINLIDLKERNPTDWSAYLVPELLTLFHFPSKEDQPALSRVIHNLELTFETFNLRYQLGMHNPDYPARIRQKIFLLDLDAYTQTTVDLRDIRRVLDTFHSAIQCYFEQSITNALRNVMNAD